MRVQQLFSLLSEAYKDRPDDFRLSIGHQQLPDPHRPMSMTNMPEIQAKVSIVMADVRKWAEEK